MTRSPKMNRSTQKVETDVNIKNQLRSIDNTMNAMGIMDPELDEHTRMLIKRFLNKFYRAHSQMSNPEQIQEFVDACKRRYLDLQRLINLSRSAMDENLELLVQRRDVNGNVRTYKHKYESRIEIINCDNDDMVVFTENVKPKCYSDLFRLAYSLIEFNRTLDDFCEYLKKDIQNCLLLILSVAKIYENLRGNAAFRKMKQQAALDRMTTPPTHFEWKDNEIRDTLTDIAYYIDNPNERAPAYIADLVDAGKKIDFSPFGEEDYHLSFRSTGIRSINERGTIPALYAAMVETYEYLPGDEIIGYNPSYRDILPSEFRCSSPCTIAIPQSKIDDRIIHIATNSDQDRGNYYHRRLANLLRLLPTDCTFNQEYGVLFARRVTSQSFIEKNMNNIYCTDISDATGTMEQEFQEAVLEAFFGSKRAQHYMLTVTRERLFHFSDGQKVLYKQTMGQPQGYKGSFPAFALGHHIILRAVMRKCGMLKTSPRGIYRIVGDDIIISIADPDQVFLNTYIDMCSSMGWKIHPSKGYKYIHSDPKSIPIAEFAKVTVVNGAIYTPIPIKLILNNQGDIQSRIQLLSWMSRFFRPISITELVNMLESTKLGRSRHYNEFYKDFIYRMRKLELSNILNDFIDDCEIAIPNDVKCELIHATIYNTFRDGLLQELLPDHLRPSQGEDERNILSRLTRKYEEELLPYMVEGNKYEIVKRNNEQLIELVGQIYSQDPNLADAIMSLGLNEKTTDIIYRACEILEHDPNLMIGAEDEALQVLEELKEVFEGLSLRSLVKRHRVDTLILNGIYTRFLEYKHEGLISLTSIE